MTRACESEQRALTLVLRDDSKKILGTWTCVDGLAVDALSLDLIEDLVTNTLSMSEAEARLLTALTSQDNASDARVALTQVSGYSMLVQSRHMIRASDGIVALKQSTEET